MITILWTVSSQISLSIWGKYGTALYLALTSFDFFFTMDFVVAVDLLCYCILFLGKQYNFKIKFLIKFYSAFLIACLHLSVLYVSKFKKQKISVFRVAKYTS